MMGFPGTEEVIGKGKAAKAVSEGRTAFHRSLLRLLPPTPSLLFFRSELVTFHRLFGNVWVGLFLWIFRFISFDHQCKRRDETRQANKKETVVKKK